ncbi:MAG TPA: diacylglycerol kinase [Rhodanobacteraceae bacterium]|nr:diacylglycerol kinase [Rhodanobacteraceae bacterium]
MATTERRGIKQLYCAMIWSWQGLRAAFRFEASFRLEVYVAVVVVPLGLWLGQGPLAKVLLAGTPLLLLSTELLNSAIEAIVDKVSPEFSEMAGRAKDMGSAAVFMVLVLTGLTWVLLVGPLLWERL